MMVVLVVLGSVAVASALFAVAAEEAFKCIRRREIGTYQPRRLDL